MPEFATLLKNEQVPLVHRALWSLLWDGGIRLREALAAGVHDVDLYARTVMSSDARYGAGPEAVPLGDTTVNLLREVIGTRRIGPLFPNETGQALSVATVGRWARSVGVNAHTFRLSGQCARGEAAVRAQAAEKS
ncbi:site-specific integrase [Actinacidiphila alni]|uniref:tyrosine-type recombinase/integrase n=1 Tax=Actinacidiphila alni TaxID=380248 RepID=UPI0015A57245|nr:tyrosine-type recombinase/integrase [Actinacidiphila alni]